ncbi:hypothetical protein Bpfe_017181 [Biomphalaria pfeifferi]|uniref:Uncharacterized protein n=1 Tax=Biomphalaria pfeifferi TaxID=112525 RepID=A0AAD8BGB2_BIOPF|nr:hypothetical protein Bpfe_017181 [Biomphalaria pfeifferi]
MATSLDVTPIDFNKIIQEYQNLKQFQGEVKLARLKVKTVKDSVKWKEHGHSNSQGTSDVHVQFNLVEGLAKGLNREIEISLPERNLPLSKISINLAQVETKATVPIENKEFGQREFTGDVALVLRLTGCVLFQSGKCSEIPFSQILHDLLEHYSKSHTSLPKYISPLTVECNNMNIPVEVRWTLKGHIKLL